MADAQLWFHSIEFAFGVVEDRREIFLTQYSSYSGRLRGSGLGFFGSAKMYVSELHLLISRRYYLLTFDWRMLKLDKHAQNRTVRFHGSTFSNKNALSTPVMRLWLQYGRMWCSKVKMHNMNIEVSISPAIELAPQWAFINRLGTARIKIVTIQRFQSKLALCELWHLRIVEIKVIFEGTMQRIQNNISSRNLRLPKLSTGWGHWHNIEHTEWSMHMSAVGPCISRLTFSPAFDLSATIVCCLLLRCIFGRCGFLFSPVNDDYSSQIPFTHLTQILAWIVKWIDKFDAQMSARPVEIQWNGNYVDWVPVQAAGAWCRMDNPYYIQIDSAFWKARNWSLFRCRCRNYLLMIDCVACMVRCDVDSYLNWIT